MKSTWISLRLRRSIVSGRRRRRGVAATEGDVARGVLVQQGVVEHGPELSDPALAVDECDLS